MTFLKDDVLRNCIIESLSTVFPFDSYMKKWSVYIIECDGRYLYTGISTDVKRRLGEHDSNDGKAAKSTRPFSSIDLVYQILIGARSLASKIEYQIKKLPKQKKELIVSNGFNKDELIEFLELDQ